MKLRVERRHQYGNSNSDFQSKPTILPPSTVNKFSTLYLNRLAQHSHKPSPILPVEPKVSQATFCLVQNKNQAHLRGVSTQNKKPLPDNTMDKSVRPVKKQKPQSQRPSDRQQPGIETRPVYWHRGHDTTSETDFDLTRIINFKKSLFCRYNKRKNHGKTFFAWDRNSKGYIDEHDIISMSKQFGLPINEKEAKLLIACADIDNNGRLNPREFMNLLFNQKIVSSLEGDEEAVKMGEEKLKAFLGHKLAEIQSTGMRDMLLNKMQEHKTYLQRVINADEFDQKDYSVTRERFIGIMGKISHKDKILTNAEIDFLYDSFKDKTESVNMYDFFNKVKEHENTEFSELKSEAYVPSNEHEPLLQAQRWSHCRWRGRSA